VNVKVKFLKDLGEEIKNPLLKGYCYLRDKILNCRRIDRYFSPLFIGQIALLLFLLLYGIDWRLITIAWQLISPQINTVSSLLISLLTTALVYVYFAQRPELRFTGFLVEPKENSSVLVCKEKYIEKILEENGILVPQVRHVHSQNFPVLKKIVECKKPPQALVIRNDITNLGTAITKIHEYQFEQIQPVERKSIKKVFREDLTHQERKTVSIIFPTEFPSDEKESLKDDLYEFKITVYAATQKCTKRIWILISQNTMKIEWCESRFHGWK
jgi:hypothetical protein